MQSNRNILFIKFRDWNLAMYNKFLSNSPYLDLDTYFPEHKILENNWEIIKDEIESVINKSKDLPKFHEVDDGQEYISDNDGIAWSMYNIKTYGFWHKSNLIQCPKTVALLKSMKSVTSVYFSILDAGKHIPAHNGPYKGILRYQLALSVPKKGVCQIFVDNKSYSWTEGKGVLFDDTYVHEVQNKTNEKRIAMLLDIRRKDFPFFLRIYDFVFYKIIQLLVILNGTMKKSTVKKNK
jgi:beta-hydroxylase|tara:strand:- start:10238 stop:10948 length:711 start_codon:yes stop_codon:yes gene_type:complete